MQGMTIMHDFTVKSLFISNMVDKEIHCALDLTLDWD